MLASRFAKLALAVATLLGQAVVANNRCDRPSVRREWRSMTRKQRIGWIDAVKVRVLDVNSGAPLAPLTLLCLVSQHVTSQFVTGSYLQYHLQRNTPHQPE